MASSIKLKINGKEIEFGFGLRFVGELIESTGLTLDEIVVKSRSNPFKMIPTMMYLSALHSKDRRGEEIDFTEIELADMIDDSGGINQDSIVKFLSKFTDSLLKDVPKTPESKEDAPKKK